MKAFAEVGSKFDGTRLENEHIGHTHVAVRGCAVLELDGNGE